MYEKDVSAQESLIGLSVEVAPGTSFNNFIRAVSLLAQSGLRNPRPPEPCYSSSYTGPSIDVGSGINPPNPKMRFTRYFPLLAFIHLKIALSNSTDFISDLTVHRLL
jgi:hypothetical protein